MSKTTSTQIAPDLAKALAAYPDAEFSLLIRVVQADDQTEQSLLDCGATIRYRLTLIPTFAVTCTGAAALSFATYAWVRHIEADLPVHTMTSPSPM